MDEQLAAIYGTGSDYVDESDLEKTAAAELLVKLAEEQGVDLDDFSDEEVGEMLDELYTGDDDGQEKFAEADYLGRIMAHSMVQELDNIEKEAGRVSDFVGRIKGKGGKAVKEVKKKIGPMFGPKEKRLHRAGRYVKEAPGRAWQGVKDRPKAYRQAGEDLKTVFSKDKMDKMDRLRAAGRAARGVAPEAGLLAAGGGGAAYALSRKKKEASALESLAEQRAYELAAEAGYIDDFYKEASVDMAIEQRALEICEDNGIPVEWNA